jgi:hypothetical protein
MGIPERPAVDRGRVADDVVERRHRGVAGVDEGEHVGDDLRRPRLPHGAQRGIVGQARAEGRRQRVGPTGQGRHLVAGLVEQRGRPVEVVANDLDGRDRVHGAGRPQADAHAQDRRAHALVDVGQDRGHRDAERAEGGVHAGDGEAVEGGERGPQRRVRPRVHRVAEEVQRRLDLGVGPAEALHRPGRVVEERRVAAGGASEGMGIATLGQQPVDGPPELAADRHAGVGLHRAPGGVGRELLGVEERAGGTEPVRHLTLEVVGDQRGAHRSFRPGRTSMVVAGVPRS